MADISPTKLMRAMAEAQRLRDEIGTEDEKLLVDSIDGETDAFAIIDRLSEMAIADKLLVERAKERVARFEARADRARGTIQRMLEALGITKLERSLVTASISEGPKAVVVTDQAALPDFYFRRSVDKVALGKDLRAGKEVAGATLNNGAPVLTIRSR